MRLCHNRFQPPVLSRFVMSTLFTSNNAEVGNRMPAEFVSFFASTPTQDQRCCDVFVTMVANPHWPEITESIPAGDHISQHPVIVARVFYMKLQTMIATIIQQKLFGDVMAYVYRIEWRSRNIPHAHCLFVLKQKISTVARINSIVSAEIPCPRQFPLLNAIVCRRMIHAPCGNSTDAPCHRKNGTNTCYRLFPKPLSETTIIVGTNACANFRNDLTPACSRWVSAVPQAWEISVGIERPPR